VGRDVAGGEEGAFEDLVVRGAGYADAGGVSGCLYIEVCGLVKDLPCPDGLVQDRVAVDCVLGGPDLGRRNPAHDALALALRHGQRRPARSLVLSQRSPSGSAS
jgi:hypothetical protein